MDRVGVSLGQCAAHLRRWTVPTGCLNVVCGLMWADVGLFLVAMDDRTVSSAIMPLSASEALR